MEAVRTNVIGTDNVLTSAIEAGVESVICLSTDKVAYPINSMGMTKATEEKVAIAKSRMSGKTKICRTRYGNVMCSRGSVIPLWIDQNKEIEAMEIQRTEIPLDPRLVSLYDNLKSFYETGKYVDENDVIDKVKFCFGISGNSVYDKMLSYPYIVAKALEENIDYNRDKLLEKKCIFLKSEVQDLTTKYTRHKGKCIYVRQIIKNEFDRIPINDHIFDKCAYVHINGIPFLITKITEELEDDFIEFNNMLPQEIRLLSSLSFPLEIGAGTFSIKACGSFFTIPLLDDACEGLTEKELAEVKLGISLFRRMHNYSTVGNKEPIVPRDQL